MKTYEADLTVTEWFLIKNDLDPEAFVGGWIKNQANISERKGGREFKIVRHPVDGSYLKFTFMAEVPE